MCFGLIVRSVENLAADKGIERAISEAAKLCRNVWRPSDPDEVVIVSDPAPNDQDLAGVDSGALPKFVGAVA